MFGGQVSVPLVVRMPQGAGPPARPDPLALPGGDVPARPRPARRRAGDARRRQGAAQDRDPRRQPVIFIEHESLYGVRGEVPDGEDGSVDFGQARVAREGADVTIVGVSRMALTAERAAATLAAEHGVQAEVIDPRTLRPLDLDTILASVAGHQPLRDRRGGLAARRRRREPRRADRRAGLRRPRRARRAGDRRGRADALLQAAGGHRLSARAPGRAGGAETVGLAAQAQGSRR